MCSATPNIMKPADLYYFLNLLRPDIFDSFHKFACRYCNARFRNTKDLYLADDGFCKVTELNLIMYQKFFVRSADENKNLPASKRLVAVPMDQQKKQEAEEWLAKHKQQQEAYSEKGQVVSHPYTND